MESFSHETKSILTKEISHCDQEKNIQGLAVGERMTWSKCFSALFLYFLAGAIYFYLPWFNLCHSTTQLCEYLNAHTPPKCKHNRYYFPFNMGCSSYTTYDKRDVVYTYYKAISCQRYKEEKSTPPLACVC